MRALIRFSAARFEPQLTAAVSDVGEIPELAVDVVDRLSALEESTIDLSVAIADCRRVLRSLVYPNSLTAQGLDRSADVVRYLRALRHRVDQLPGDRERDLANTGRLRELETLAEHSADAEVPWMLQELRVSLWAQHLGTNGSVSAARIRRRLEPTSNL